MTKLEGCGHVAAIVQALATTVALGLGAWWFIEQRQTYPHAHLEQTVQVVPVGHGTIAVEIEAQFQNSGKMLIHLTRANVKLQNVSEKPYDYDALAQQNEAAYWKALRPVATPSRGQFTEGELRWPVIKQYLGPIDHLIEPGETDLIVFTFLLSCQTVATDKPTKPHFVRVASDVLRPKGSGPVNFAWKARSFVDVSSACGGKGESK